MKQCNRGTVNIWVHEYIHSSNYFVLYHFNNLQPWICIETNEIPKINYKKNILTKHWEGGKYCPYLIETGDAKLSVWSSTYLVDVQIQTFLGSSEAYHLNKLNGAEAANNKCKCCPSHIPANLTPLHSPAASCWEEWN